MPKPQSLYIKDDLSELEKLKKRQELLKSWRLGNFDKLFSYNFDPEVIGQKNCENLVGSVGVPVGVAGPVRFEQQIISSKQKPASYWLQTTSCNALIPLATTEGALVASVNRGCKVINQGGGAKVWVKKVGMSRSPVFECEDAAGAHFLVAWLEKNLSRVVKLVENTSGHLKFLELKTWIRGNLVFTRFVFDTSEAMGMNMVTIGLQHAWDKLLGSESELKNTKLISISGNVCSDKKDSAINRLLGRGYSVQIEAKLKAKNIQELLGISAQNLFQAHLVKNLIGSNVAGSGSQNMQVANVAAAIYLATGQDPAHVVEAAQSSTTVRVTQDGLLIGLNLPNINVGVVGGGTSLPAQTQARKLITEGKLNSVTLAAVVGVASLAAEISGLSALGSHTLAKAHQKLGRKKS